MRTISFRKQLCSICLVSFSPLHLKHIKHMVVCSECLKLMRERQDEWREIAQRPESAHPENYTKPQEANLVTQIARKGNNFLDEVNDVLGSKINPRFIGIVTGRSAVYLGGSISLDPESPLYALTSGIMIGDLITWFVFNILQIPFIGTTFLLEFGIYEGIVGYLGSTGRLVQIPEGGEPFAIAFLVCLATGVIKTAFWSMKVFTVGVD